MNGRKLKRKFLIRRDKREEYPSYAKRKAIKENIYLAWTEFPNEVSCPEASKSTLNNYTIREGSLTSEQNEGFIVPRTTSHQEGSLISKNNEEIIVSLLGNLVLDGTCPTQMSLENNLSFPSATPPTTPTSPNVYHERADC